MLFRRALFLAYRSLLQEQPQSRRSWSAACKIAALLDDTAASAPCSPSLWHRSLHASSLLSDAAQASMESKANKRKQKRSGSAEPALSQMKKPRKQAKLETKQLDSCPVECPSYEEVAAAADHRQDAADGHHAVGKQQEGEVSAILESFQSSADVKDQALALYINAKLFPEVAAAFANFLWRGMTSELAAALIASRGEDRREKLFDLFAPYALQAFSKEIQQYRSIVKAVDMTRPHLWYSSARSMSRRFIYHAGPTNSGKTFSALQAMSSAQTGLYCGPLRLLAMEVYDSLNAGGTLCNLLTGQEKRQVPGARHTACTIEMANLAEPVDVAVIDEVQGLMAKEIHLCGDGSALQLVQNLTAAMHEQVEVQRYERFTPLQVEPLGLPRGYQEVRPGDCIVAFSRRDIYDIKHTIEALTGKRVCVVYGALPPEMRRQQAKLFNEPGNEYSIMVASDAVGMGLNLNIRRLVFHTLHKAEGLVRRPISVTEIKQIAGRAGRRNSEYKVGIATCLNQRDIPFLQEALDMPLDDLLTKHAGLFPEFNALEAFAGQLLLDDFGLILARFAEDARLEGTYFLCKQESVMRAARLLSCVDDLSLQERFWFCMAPANLRDPRMAAALLQFAKRYAAKLPVEVDVVIPAKAPRGAEALMDTEATHQVLSLWLWLSYRFKPESFPGRELAEHQCDMVVTMMEDALQGMCAPRVYTSDAVLCAKCRKPGPSLDRLLEKRAAHSQPDSNQPQIKLPMPSSPVWFCLECRAAKRAAFLRAPESILQQPDTIVGEFLYKYWAAKRHGSDLLSGDNPAGWWVVPEGQKGRRSQASAAK